MSQAESHHQNVDVLNGRCKVAVGARLALAREVLGYNQTEFAKTVGIHKNTYNQYEVGGNYPKIVSAHAFLDVHGLTFDWIYLGRGYGMPTELLQAIRQLHAVRHGKKASKKKTDRQGRPLRVSARGGSATTQERPSLKVA